MLPFSLYWRAALCSLLFLATELASALLGEPSPSPAPFANSPSPTTPGPLFFDPPAPAPTTSGPLEQKPAPWAERSSLVSGLGDLFQWTTRIPVEDSSALSLVNTASGDLILATATSLFRILPSNGYVLWKTSLPVEHSDAMPRSLLVVQVLNRVFFTTNGVVYCLNLFDGTMVWSSAQTNISVEAAGSSDGHTTLFGSGTFPDSSAVAFALQVSDGSLVWAKQLDAGFHKAPFSCFEQQNQRLFQCLCGNGAADGVIASMDPNDGSIMWESGQSSHCCSYDEFFFGQSPISCTNDNTRVFAVGEGSSIMSLGSNTGELETVLASRALIFVGDEGIITLTEPDCSLKRHWGNGTVAWSRTLPECQLSNVWSNGKTVVVVAPSVMIINFNDGSVKWRSPEQWIMNSCGNCTGGFSLDGGQFFFNLGSRVVSFDVDVEAPTQLPPTTTTVASTVTGQTVVPVEGGSSHCSCGTSGASCYDLQQKTGLSFNQLESKLYCTCSGCSATTIAPMKCSWWTCYS